MSLLKYDNDDRIFILDSKNYVKILSDKVYCRYKDKIYTLKKLRVYKTEGVIGVYKNKLGFVLFYVDKIKIHRKNGNVTIVNFVPHESMYVKTYNNLVQLGRDYLYLFDVRTNKIVEINKHGDIKNYDMVEHKCILGYDLVGSILYLSSDNKLYRYRFDLIFIAQLGNKIEMYDDVVYVKDGDDKDNISYYVENGIVHMPHKAFRQGRIVGNTIYIVDGVYHHPNHVGKLEKLEPSWSVYKEI